MTPLDLGVDVEERSLGEPRDLAPDRRLARAHEADERDVLPERAYLGDHGMRLT